MTEPTIERAGFIGTGLMGGPMALNLCRAGVELRVWNRSPDKTQALAAAGATVCASKKALAADCPVVFLCVFDTDAVADVLFGDDGIADALPAGAIVVDHSTIDPGAAAGFAARLAADHQVGFVDAPVTGGVVGAEAGTLTIFGGGESKTVETVRPLVMHMAGRFEHLGASGAGQTAKVCNQIMVQTTIASAAEMVKMAEANQLDVPLLLELLGTGVAGSPILDLMGNRMVGRSDEVSGPLRVAIKDMDIIQAAGAKFNVALPMSGIATELYRQAMARDLGDKDNSQVIRIFD